MTNVQDYGSIAFAGKRKDSVALNRLRTFGGRLGIFTGMPSTGNRW